jgi:uncharacterized protein
VASLADLRDQLCRIVQDQMDLDSAHDLAHLDRVWMNAQQIADGSGDLDVLLAACHLHDLVNLPKDDANRAFASRQSAEKAGPILALLGFSPDQVKATQHAIEAHSFSAGIPAETFEAKVLRDADRLDSLGAIGIARTFLVAGALGLPLYDPADPFAQNRVPDDSKYSLDHWQIKLLKLPDGMITDKGRELAQNRVKVMLRFLDDLSEEIVA